MYFDYDEDKNKWLQQERGVSFEEVIEILESDAVILDTPHPNPAAYPNQRIFIITLHDYPHMVPYVQDEEKIFLKTIFPNHRFKS